MNRDCYSAAIGGATFEERMAALHDLVAAERREALESLSPGARDGVRDVRLGAGNASRPPGARTNQPIPSSAPGKIVHGGTIRARRVVPRNLSDAADGEYAGDYLAGVAIARSSGLGAKPTETVLHGPRLAMERRLTANERKADETARAIPERAAYSEIASRLVIGYLDVPITQAQLTGWLKVNRTI